MTLSDLASIGSFVSGLAVLISLIYLALQIRQNTQAQRVTAHQNRQDFARQFLIKLSDEATAALFIRASAGNPDLTPTEFLQFNALMRYWFLGISGVFWLHENGVIDHESTADSMEVLRNRLSEPGCRAAWYVSRKMFLPSFQALVETLVAESPVVADRREFDIWKAALARQKPDAGG
ncbi:MAG: hypothetical protein WDN08_01170 [Rhizomicrobium sp.]